MIRDIPLASRRSGRQHPPLIIAGMSGNHQAHTPWEWHPPIFDRARELGLIAFSTPFNETAVDFLKP